MARVVLILDMFLSKRGDKMLKEGDKERNEKKKRLCAFQKSGIRWEVTLTVRMLGWSRLTTPPKEE